MTEPRLLLPIETGEKCLKVSALRRCRDAAVASMWFGEKRALSYEMQAQALIIEIKKAAYTLYPEIKTWAAWGWNSDEEGRVFLTRETD